MKRSVFGLMVITGLAASQVMAAKAGPMDANSDGKVSKQEFCDARAKAAKKAGKEFKKAGAEKMFKAKDTNGDGFLSGDELTAVPKPKTVEESEE
jgi:hypothetical protein